MTTPGQRLFFALWPDEANRVALAAATAGSSGLSGRAVAASNLHLTLVFLGNIDPSSRARVEHAADKIHSPTFDLVLDELGWWPRSKVIWLAPSAPPEFLLSLAIDLNQAAMASGLRTEERPYRPHVTLMRRLQHRPQLPAVVPIRWPVCRFCLVESITESQGVAYQVRRSWALG